jgi:hypothetical protein
VRWTGTFAALAVLLCAACTSSGRTFPIAPRPTPSRSSSLSPSGPTSSAPVAPGSGSSAAGSRSGPPAPPRPSVPADVPTTGPNARRGERPPIMPLEATQHTPEGARAFAEFFIKTIDWGYATTSSTYMRHYFQKSCIGCISTARALDSAARAQHHFIDDRFTVQTIEAQSSSMVAPRILIKFDVSSSEVVDKNGKFVDGEPALTNLHERMTLSWHSDHWRIDEFLAQI